MEKLKLYLPYIAVAVFLFIVVFGENSRSSQKIKTLQETAKNNEKLIKSLQIEKEQLAKRSDSLTKEINNTKTVINTIVKEKEIRTKYIDKLTDEELQKYFDEYK